MLDLSNVQLHESVILVVPALLLVGYALKQTPKCPDWVIVWAMLILGCIAGMVAIGPNLQGVVNGIIAAGFAITTNQVYKQTTKRK